MKKSAYLGFLPILLSGVSTQALAQEDTQPSVQQAQADYDEIIVTAQRRSQSLFDVPLAISALAGESLQTKGITNSANLATAVPNLQVSSPYGGTQPNFSLRGISVANEYNSNQASPVGVYVDDVYIAARTSHGMGLFDLDRIEVLRGPQGTLFGRNTTGGAINFITRGPRLNGNEGYAEAGYGNFNTFKANGAIEATMVEDQLGVRFAVNYEKGDGQFNNVLPGGRDANSIDSLQGRATLRFKPGNGDVDVKIRAYAGRDRGTQAASHALTGPHTPGQGFFEVQENRLGDSNTDAWGVAANIGWEITPALSVTSITSYDGGKLDLQQAVDGSALDVLDIRWKSNFRQFSQEVRFNYDGGDLQLVGGGFYGWDSTVTDNIFNIGEALGDDGNGGFYQHYRQTRKSYAAFLQGDYNITDQLVLTLGGRYTWDRARYEDGYAYLFAGDVGGERTPIASTVPCIGTAGTCAYDPSLRFAIPGRNNALTGRAALSYTFDSGALVYASYSRGYRSGAFNGGGYTSSAGISYIEPERVNAYEAGVKGRFLDNRLSLSAATFFYDYSNQQVQDTRSGPVSFLVNAPKSEVYGGEIEATVNAASNLSFNFSAGYLHATYKELTLQDTVLDGNDLPFAPRWTGTAGFDWTMIDGQNGSLTFSPVVNYFSRQFFSPFNNVDAVGTGHVNSELQQEAYAKVNASLVWKKDNLQLRGWVNNLLNHKSYSYGLDLRGADFPFNLLVPASPRTYGVTARVSF